MQATHIYAQQDLLLLVLGTTIHTIQLGYGPIRYMVPTFVHSARTGRNTPPHGAHQLVPTTSQTRQPSSNKSYKEL